MKLWKFNFEIFLFFKNVFWLQIEFFDQRRIVIQNDKIFRNISKWNDENSVSEIFILWERILKLSLPQYKQSPTKD